MSTSPLAGKPAPASLLIDVKKLVADYYGRKPNLEDPQQRSPLDNSALEAHFAARIAAHLEACEAPEEQYARLGLPPRSVQ